jgi:diguanylate cyclase (GGDEF)-like protein
MKGTYLQIMLSKLSRGRAGWLGLALCLPLSTSVLADLPRSNVVRIEQLATAADVRFYQRQVSENYSSAAGRGEAYRLLGARWEQLGQVQEALGAYQLAVASLESEPASAELVSSLGDRSYMIYLLTSDRSLYCPDRERALAVARELGQSQPLVDALVSRAFCYQGSEESRQGMADLQEAMRIAQSEQLTGNTRAMISNARAGLYRGLQLHDRAYSAYLEAYREWHEAGEIADEFNMLHSLVGEAIEVGRWSDGREHIAEMFALASEYPDSDYLFFSHFNEARLALAKKNYTAAELAYSRAIELSDATAERSYVIEAYVYRAEARIWLSKFELARSDLQHSELAGYTGGDSYETLKRLNQAIAGQDVFEVLAVMLKLRRAEAEKRFGFVDANNRLFAEEHDEYVAQYEASLLKQQLQLQELELARMSDRASLARQSLINLGLLTLLLLLAAVWMHRAMVTQRRLAYTDYLTGIANRANVVERGRKLVSKSHRRSRTFSVVLLDIDNFKSINDALGHSGGDMAIRQTVQQLQQALQTGEWLGRVGGEEFIVVLPGCNEQEALQRAENFRWAVASEGLVHGEQRPVKLTVSLGVAALEPGERFGSLVNRADSALYRAKESGRDCVRAASRSGDLEGVVQVKAVRPVQDGGSGVPAEKNKRAG